MIRALALAALLGAAACQPPSMRLDARARGGEVDVKPTLAFPGPVTLVLHP